MLVSVVVGDGGPAGGQSREWEADHPAGGWAGPRRRDAARPGGIDLGERVCVAVPASPAEAWTVAEGVREDSAAAAPVSFVEQLEQALEATAAEGELLEEQIAALEPGAIDPATTARRGFLESQIATLEARAAALALDLAYPELANRDPEGADRDPGEIAAEMAGLETLLIRLNRDLEALPTEETEPSSTTDRLAKLALEQRLRNGEIR